jgi:hypothetical protein
MNFQTAIDGLDGQVAAIKELLKNLVSRNDLEAMVGSLQPLAGRADGATAGGRIRCLLCGKAAGAVAGMITESEVAKMMGTPQCGIVRGAVSDAYVLAYGRDALKARKKAARKPVVPSLNAAVSLNVV